MLTFSAPARSDSAAFCTSGFAMIRDTASLADISKFESALSLDSMDSPPPDTPCISSSSRPKYWFDEIDVAPVNDCSRVCASPTATGSYAFLPKYMSDEIAFWLPNFSRAVVGASSSTVL